MVDAQLQGGPCDPRQGAGRAPLPDDPRNRFCRHGRDLDPRRLEGRGQGDPQRLGLRRDPPGRLRRKGAGERELAGAAAAGHERARGHGDRNRGLHRHAGGDGARGSRRHPEERTGARHRCCGGRRLGRIAILSRRGFEVTASTGRAEEADYLKKLGAHEIIERKELAGPPKPLAKERWAGGIDTVGSTTLANVLSMTRYGGMVAACGLAGGMDLPTSVAPFILRGVSLVGIDSVMRPIADRRTAWMRLDGELDRGKLAAMTSGTATAETVAAARNIVAGQVRGRLAVRVG